MELDSDPFDVVQGTCMTMCPRAEMRLREKESLLHYFEICPEDRGRGKRKPKADPERMVKAFSRAAAGRTQSSPADIRCAPVLLLTISYLFQNIVPITDRDWVEVYDFVFDRLRAVRQDAVVQALRGPPLIALLERCVRFLVYAGFRLSDRSAEHFDPVINDQHLLECLKQLLRLYQVTPTSRRSPRSPRPLYHRHRPHQEALYLLHSLGSPDSLTHGLSLPPPLRASPLVRQALAINMAYLQGNYVQFFRRVKKLTSPLCLCAVHRHFHHIRVQALRVMSTAYSSKDCQFPVNTLHQLLYMDSWVLRELLHACGLLQDSDKESAQHVNFLKTKFSLPEKVDRYRQRELNIMLDDLDISSLLLGDLPNT